MYRPHGHMIVTGAIRPSGAITTNPASTVRPVGADRLVATAPAMPAPVEPMYTPPSLPVPNAAEALAPTTPCAERLARFREANPTYMEARQAGSRAEPFTVYDLTTAGWAEFYRQHPDCVPAPQVQAQPPATAATCNARFGAWLEAHPEHRNGALDGRGPMTDEGWTAFLAANPSCAPLRAVSSALAPHVPPPQPFVDDPASPYAPLGLRAAQNVTATPAVPASQVAAVAQPAPSAGMKIAGTLLLGGLVVGLGYAIFGGE